MNKKCPICKKVFKSNSNSQKFCTEKCRNFTYREYRADFQRNRANERAVKPSSKKVKCLVCKRWYVQLGTHVIQAHSDMFKTARDYKKYFDLEVKKGVVPTWYKNMKGEQVFENGTVKNLKAGKKFWYKKGSTVAGRYKRSHITLERLRNLYKLRK